MVFLQKHKEKYTTVEKLVPDLHDKSNYVCSLKNLQLCLRQGLLLTKIHRVLAMDQSDFMSQYIDFNSEKRQKAKSKFEGDLFKLANNGCYGKFIEDVRKHCNVEAVQTQVRAQRLISRPQFKGFSPAAPYQ